MIPPIIPLLKGTRNSLTSNDLHIKCVPTAPTNEVANDLEYGVDITLLKELISCLECMDHRMRERTHDHIQVRRPLNLTHSVNCPKSPTQKSLASSPKISPALPDAVFRIHAGMSDKSSDPPTCCVLREDEGLPSASHRPSRPQWVAVDCTRPSSPPNVVRNRKGTHESTSSERAKAYPFQLGIEPCPSKRA